MAFEGYKEGICMGIRTKVFWKREMGDLPNQEGFKFIGLLADGTEVPCIVTRDATGLHRACHRETVEWMYPRLNGWRPV